MKKKLLAILMATAMTASLAACGGGGSDAKKEGGSKDGELSGTVTVWSWDVALAHMEAVQKNLTRNIQMLNFCLKKWVFSRYIRK